MSHGGLPAPAWLQTPSPPETAAWDSNFVTSANALITQAFVRELVGCLTARRRDALCAMDASSSEKVRAALAIEYGSGHLCVSQRLLDIADELTAASRRRTARRHDI